MLLNRDQREQLRQLGALSTIGLEMALSIALGFVGGRWLDGKFGTGPWLQWVGLALGLAAAGMSLYRLVRHAQNMMKDSDNDSRNDVP